MYRLSYVFFFSSRRRHTRSLCDWSSDVCSSDLGVRVAQVLVKVADHAAAHLQQVAAGSRAQAARGKAEDDAVQERAVTHARDREERRVGKDGRARARTRREKKDIEEFAHVSDKC